MIMVPLYPAQSSLLKNCFIKHFKTENIDTSRLAKGKTLLEQGYIVRHVTLEKEGTRFSGLLVGKPETINNGKWVLQAGGNCQTAEASSWGIEKYEQIGYNLLAINNPGVGRSEGTSTPENMGECQRTALAYLKTAIKANRVVLAGYSLGGAAIGELINQYNFENSETNFLVVRQMTFNEVSQMGEKFTENNCLLNFLAKPLAVWSGCQMINLDSAKKLAVHNIREIIIQGDADEVIPMECSLLEALKTQDEEILKNKEFQILEGAGHLDSDPLFDATIEHILAWDQALDASLNAMEIAE